MRTVFITGATGFVGSHIAEELVRRGFRVKALIRRTSNLRWIKDLPIEFVVGDLRSSGEWIDALNDVDVVLHVAGVIKALSEDGYMAGNYESTANLALAAQKAGVKRFVFISSRAAAGPSPPSEPFDEDFPPNPISAYGRSKLAAERFLLNETDLPVVILRPVVVYGPRDGGVLRYFKLVKKHLLPFVGKGNWVNVVHVSDLVDAVMRAMEVDAAVGEVFFIGNEAGHHITEIGRMIAEVLGVGWVVKIKIPVWIAKAYAALALQVSKLVGKPSIINPDKIREFEAQWWLCSSAKAQKILGWQPKVDEIEGLRWTAEWYRLNRWL